MFLELLKACWPYLLYFVCWLGLFLLMMMYPQTAPIILVVAISWVILSSLALSLSIYRSATGLGI